MFTQHIFLLIFTWAVLAWPVPAAAIPEDQYQEAYDSLIVPFYKEGIAGSLQGAKDIRIVTRSFTHASPLGTIIVAEGYSENLRKYAEVAYDLYREGYSVILFDHRGQGYSQRMIEDPHRAYIDQFENWVQDLKSVVAMAEKREPKTSKYILAHSMGAAITARYLEENPKTIRAAAFSAPLIKINLQGYWELPLRLYVEALGIIGQGEMYIRGPFDPAQAVFAKNTVTHSDPRFNILNRGITAQEPKLGIWGTTARWLSETLKGTAVIREAAPSLTTPLLFFQAGQDSFVVSDESKSFCQRVPHCEVKEFPEAKHEILQESDTIRDEALNQALQFFKKYN